MAALVRNTPPSPFLHPQLTHPSSTYHLLDRPNPPLTPQTQINIQHPQLRLDSFSKVSVPGARLGWLTASAQLVERYERHAEVASQGPSGFSQAVVWRLVDQGWGHEGYVRWLMGLRGRYARRRDVLVGACEEGLPVGVCSWGGTGAGMFVCSTTQPLLFMFLSWSCWGVVC